LDREVWDYGLRVIYHLIVVDPVMSPYPIVDAVLQVSTIVLALGRKYPWAL
jgi:hypothetical protein